MINPAGGRQGESVQAGCRAGKRHEGQVEEVTFESGLATCEDIMRITNEAGWGVSPLQQSLANRAHFV